MPSPVKLAEKVSVAVTPAGKLAMAHRLTGLPRLKLPTEVATEPGTITCEPLMESRITTLLAEAPPLLTNVTVY